jgi:hypothetical protein
MTEHDHIIRLSKMLSGAEYEASKLRAPETILEILAQCQRILAHRLDQEEA